MSSAQVIIEIMREGQTGREDRVLKDTGTSWFERRIVKLARGQTVAHGLHLVNGRASPAPLGHSSGMSKSLVAVSSRRRRSSANSG